MHKTAQQLKSLLLVLIFSTLLFLVGKVRAENSTNTFSSSYIFNSDLSAQVTFREEFTNTSNESVVDKYRVIIPYYDAKNVTVSVGGVNRSVSLKESNSFVEAIVEIPALSEGQKVKAITTFSTLLAAKDFVGMKVITLAKIDPKVETLGQTLVLPSEFGQITSLSSDCEVLYKQNTTINCDRGEKIYINTGDKFHLNFSLSQDLKNSSGKDSLTRFLLPFDGLGQNLFFYETSSDITAKKDDAGNLYIETKVFKNEEKQIDVNGVIEGGSFMNPTSEDSLLDETDVWNFSSDKISGIYNSFSGDDKVQQVYNYLLRTFEPSTEENFKREKTSELLGRKNLTSIEYSDLATSLLRRLGIKSFILVGDNNGSDDGFFSSWVTYLDPGDGKWKEMDPYFADSSEFGEHLFINHDRITYFKLDGSEDEKLVSELIDEGKTYIESNFYDLDQNLLSKELVYSVQIVTPDVISLNTNAEIALRLTNHSSRLIHFGKITRNKKEIQINKQDENIWVLPSQSYNYDLNGVILAGLLKTISANLSFDYSVNTVSEFKEENISTDVSAVPTFKTFLPYLIGLMFIGAIVFIYFLFRKVRKRRNASKLTEGN